MLIFLGVEKKRKPCSSSAEEGVQEPPAWFAVGTEEDAAELLKRCREKNCSFPKTPNRDLLKFTEEEAGEDRFFSAFYMFSKIIVIIFLLSVHPSRSSSSGPFGVGLAQPLQLLSDMRQQHQT